MKLYVKYPSMLYKFIPQSGRTDYDSLKFAFTFLEKGDYVLDDDGNIYEVLDPGPLCSGFLESSRVIEVKKVDYNELPQKIKNAIYYLAKSYPSSERCRKVLEVVQQG